MFVQLNAITISLVVTVLTLISGNNMSEVLMIYVVLRCISPIEHVPHASEAGETDTTNGTSVPCMLNLICYLH